MKKKVLFLCTGNSCRSQMAEGLLRNMAGDRFDAFSAGVKPTGLNPFAVRVMNEIGIDISDQKSKSVQEFLGEQFDYVVTVCDNAKQSCPTFPGKYKRIHWDLEDPAKAGGTDERILNIFKDTRGKIREKISSFLALQIF